MKGRLPLGLLAAAVMAGGLRSPVLGAVGAAGVAILAAVEAPLSLGPAVWWLPWIGWAAASCAFNAQPWAGLPVIARWSAFAVFLALASQWDGRARRLWLAGTCALGAILAAAALATGAGVGFGSTMTGLLPPYYNYTAFVLAAAAAAAAAWALSSETSKPARVWLWILVIGLTICLLLARSRGGLLGLSAATAWLAWRRGGIKVTLALFAAAAVSILIAPDAWKSAAFKSGRALGEARPAIWRAALDMGTDAPWLGEGPGNFTVGFLRRPARSPHGAANWGLWTPFAHSEPLQAAAETGIAGMALWLLGFGASVFGAFYGRAGRDAAQNAARAALIAVLPQLLMDNMLQVPGLAFFFASLLAVSRHPSPARGASLPRVSALALAVFALAAAAPGFLAARAEAGSDLDERLARTGRAVRIFPMDAERREDFAQTLEEAGRRPEAFGQWSAAAELAPFNAIYPWRRARLSPAAEAEGLLRRTLELEPGFLTARVDHVLVLRALGRRDEANAELEDLRRRIALPTPATLSGYERTIVRRLPADLARVGVKSTAAKTE